MVGEVLNNLTIEESPGNCSCSVSDVEVWAKFLLEEVSIPVVGSVGLVGNLGGHRIESGWTIPDRSGKKVRSTSYQTGLVRR